MSDVERPEGREPEERSAPDIGARFRMERCLGSGGMGDVWLAEDLELHRPVAVKMVRAALSQNEEIRKRIERECLLHAKVGPHPHIVTLFDKVECEGRIHLIMEYVDGESLQRTLERNGDKKDPQALTVKEAVEVARQCLEALSRIHAVGIIHRDIKPANIMLSREDSGVCSKLMDFGIARLEDADEALTRLTTAHGSSPGTPMYMAPEQIDSKTFGPVSYATDVYAVGILLFQMLSGEPPFTGTLTEVLNGHINRAVPRVNLKSGRPVSEAYVEVLERALSKRPEQRFPSAHVFRKAMNALPSGDAVTTTRVIDAARLQRIIEGGATLPSSDQEAARDEDVVPSDSGVALGDAQEKARGSRLPLILGVAALVVIVGAGAVLFGGKGDGNQSARVDVDETAAPEALDASDAVATTPPSGQVETAASDSRAESASEALLEEEALDRADVSALVAPKVELALPDADVSFETEATGSADPVEQITPIDALEIGEPLTEPEVVEADMASVEEVRATEESDDEPEMKEPPRAAEPVQEADASESQGEENAKLTYVVQPGDSLSKIADQFQIDIVDLARWNLLSRPDQLSVGATLYLYERPDLPEIEVTFDSPTPSAETAETRSEPAAPSKAGTPYRRTAEDLFVAPTPDEQGE